MWNFVYFVSSFEYPLFSGLKGWWYFLNGVAIYISLQYTRYHSLKFENWFSYFWYSAPRRVKQWSIVLKNSNFFFELSRNNELELLKIYIISVKWSRVFPKLLRNFSFFSQVCFHVLIPNWIICFEYILAGLPFTTRMTCKKYQNRFSNFGQWCLV